MWQNILKTTNEEAISDAKRFAPEDSSKRASRQEVGEHKLNQLVEERKQLINGYRLKLSIWAKGSKGYKAPPHTFHNRKATKGIAPIDTKALEELLDDVVENIRHKHYDYFYDKFMELYLETMKLRKRTVAEARRGD